MRNKLDLFADQIKGNVDVLALSEAKLDGLFSAREFKIPGYALPFTLDQNQNGGGILFFFVWEDIPLKFLFSEEKPI